MKKVNLGPRGDGPYTQERVVHQGESHSHFRNQYNLRIWAPEKQNPADADKKPIAIFSDLRDNYDQPNGMSLQSCLSSAVQGMVKRLGLESLNHIDVIQHVPENATGKNVETFERVNFLMENGNVREHYRNPRFDLSARQVAELVGPENFESHYRAYEPAEIALASQEPPESRSPDLSQTEFGEASREVAQDYLQDIEPE